MFLYLFLFYSLLLLCVVLLKRVLANDLRPFSGLYENRQLRVLASLRSLQLQKLFWTCLSPSVRSSNELFTIKSRLKTRFFLLAISTWPDCFRPVVDLPGLLRMDVEYHRLLLLRNRYWCHMTVHGYRTTTTVKVISRNWICGSQDIETSQEETMQPFIAQKSCLIYSSLPFKIKNRVLHASR